MRMLKKLKLWLFRPWAWKCLSLLSSGQKQRVVQCVLWWLIRWSAGGWTISSWPWSCKKWRNWLQTVRLGLRKCYHSRYAITQCRWDCHYQSKNSEIFHEKIVKTIIILPLFARFNARALQLRKRSVAKLHVQRKRKSKLVLMQPLFLWAKEERMVAMLVLILSATAVLNCMVSMSNGRLLTGIWKNRTEDGDTGPHLEWLLVTDERKQPADHRNLMVNERYW